MHKISKTFKKNNAHLYIYAIKFTYSCHQNSTSRPQDMGSQKGIENGIETFGKGSADN
ncbi:MAG: hypothetical protein PUK16_06285 [Prevotellaceae bacterium]|nr:hypothetical protein [Prevotella sp.]MDD7530540.1 hypothetical protein [Prevotellaceae bacterium]